MLVLMDLAFSLFWKAHGTTHAARDEENSGLNTTVWLVLPF
jgi:hypothetical protein